MISAFDMFSIGIGPSSSHTVGPMRASRLFVQDLQAQGIVDDITSVKVELFGSLGQTGIGHGSGKAVILGLAGYDPETIDADLVPEILETIENEQVIYLDKQHKVKFPKQGAIVFHRRKTLPKHSNAMEIKAYKGEELAHSQIYYSIGGGFIVTDQNFEAEKQAALDIRTENPAPYPFNSAAELLEMCKESGLSVSSLMMANEKTLRKESEIKETLFHIWQVMKACIERGMKTEGILPGGLKVRRRAPSLYLKLSVETHQDPLRAMDWVDLFALAVNEENAAGGRVVTAPTNGAAGILPAVLMYYHTFIKEVDIEIATRYLLTAAAIGILYKKNASISGAEVGCQGEVGVACSMAAGALTEIMGGNVIHVENAAEIGMEHNLGLTCDPVGGLVQVPCIERNAMGSIKAINASRLALRGTGDQKVSLDKVIKTMLDTGNDMKTKYKETARGGLAVNIIEC
ncbi:MULTISPECIES: L-serine ammonia-lyase [Pseudoalteromonas]|uniref:L-serine dehydratase n=2 Tax=Pseudoalteromonas TaxID=53246 RepID=A0AAQ2EYP9_PSEO7|nr:MULTISPECIES: L-serine ammonia-lyase [Pseudoalteromonas]ATD05901.1 L-serine dehydratase [Pseudoalteromonas piscicida]KID38109.1 serine dehydratase [Pseudoalteromonas flavipulchra NCIMB 2033 = ATCC BAA-314]KJY92826.1 serine dehydratase [Pseudoalteromonas piscicida]MBD0782717.1 L-serine ammonia-lyase [Pseudoalteromonas flavipulchra]MBE0372299.1 L-serine dehydratase [Pseudoalteromonas flavipulchra NCIMB 2033 = ATCC BAA-314]